MDEMSLNTLLERCRNTVDEIAVIYHYPSNITHLLYLIVPAFIIKYDDIYLKLLRKFQF